MAYNFIQNFTTVNFSKGNSGRKWIVIHYTGGKNDTAMANSNYFKNTNRGASAHYFVDEITVVQVVKDENTAWAVGRNYGSNNLFGKCTNNNSISIEMCSTGGKIADATYRNTVELTKSLMKKYEIDANHVVRHWDVCSKCCPGWNGWGANGCDSSIWNQFKKDIVIDMPKRATKGSAGYDFFSPIGFTLSPGETIKIPTGIRCEMNEDWVLMCFPRSGLGFKYRMKLDNSVGIIDSDYAFSDNEGHIFIKLTNEGNKKLEVFEGNGFAQGIFLQYGITEDDNCDGIRNGGFGSTTK